MKVKSALIFMMLVTTIISGYVTADEQSHQSYVKRPEHEQRTQESILNDSLFVIGMTKEQVKTTLGTPYDIIRSSGSWGVREQWIYKVYDPKGYPTCSFVPTKYLYFENGKLTGWQLL
jgi:hypothetical protein